MRSSSGPRSTAMPSRRAFLQAGGVLLVSFVMPFAAVRGADSTGGALMRAGSDLVPKNRVDSFIAVTADGRIVACNGHVDLGTGLKTAFAQIVAEELDVAPDQVTMILGDTDRTPNQGPTIASASIQVSAVPMRHAAAQARQFLVEEAARRLKLPVAQLRVENGVVIGRNGTLSYATLVEGRKFELELSENVVVKDPRTYRIVGQSVPRVDIPAKVTGGLIYVHDMRLPGMLHARMVRPTHGGRDAGPLVGASFESIDEKSVAHITGIIKIVTIGDFVGVVAEREENAIKAARALKVKWKVWGALPDMTDLASVLRAIPDQVRVLKEAGDPGEAMQGQAKSLKATYVWPYQMHGSIGPSCALADFKDGFLTVWTGSQNPHALHSDLAVLLQMPEEQIRVVRMEASGCYGRNCADDVTAEAALLSIAVGRPVRLQLMREEEHAWEPKGTAQLMEVAGALTDRKTLVYDFDTRYPSNGAPLLALLHTGQQGGKPDVFEMGDRTAIPQYRCADLRVVARDLPPIVRAAWIRGVAALPNVFAHECFIDELAFLDGADPVEFRLRFMEEPRAIELVKAVTQRAGWTARPSPQRGTIATGKAPGTLRGRGFSQHRYVHGKFPGTGAAWSAWAVEVDVDPASGDVRVHKVVVGQDCGLMVNPAGVKHQIHGNVLQSISRTLKESVSFDRYGVTSLEWGAYPILTFPEVPEIDVLMMPAQGNPPLGVGESTSVPGPAAIANAIFDATGIRLREAPFTPERIRAAIVAMKKTVKP